MRWSRPRLARSRKRLSEAALSGKRPLWRYSHHRSHRSFVRVEATTSTWLRACVELYGRPLDLISDNGSPFVTWMPGVLTRFDTTLRELEVRHIRTQIDSAWTNGKIEAFWATLKSEVLDREVFRSLGDAEAALERFARY